MYAILPTTDTPSNNIAEHIPTKLRWLQAYDSEKSPSNMHPRFEGGGGGWGGVLTCSGWGLENLLSSASILALPRVP